MALHQFERVDFIRIERRDHVDGEEDLLPIRPQPDAVAVLLRIAELVENGIGLGLVELGQLPRQLLVIPGVIRPRPGLIGLRLAEIDQVDDLLAVHAERERLAELLVGEHLPQLRILVGHVQIDLNLLGSRIDQFDQAVAALLHVLGQRRLVLQRIDMALLDVQSPRDRVQHQRLDILRDIEGDPIDIGKLVAVAVDLPEIGVALHHHARRAAGVGFLDDPRVERRLVGIAPARVNFDVAAFVAEQRAPIGQVRRLDEIHDRGVVLRMKLAAIVLCKQRRMLAQRSRHLLEKQRIGAREREFDRGVVDFGRSARLASAHGSQEERGRSRDARHDVFHPAGGS